MPGLIHIDRLLVQIEENPIEGGKAAQKRHDGVRTANHESSVSAGALYRALKDSPKLISAFYEQPFWQGEEDKKAYKKNPKHLNKHCHQFIYGARDGSEGKRAEDHAFATQEYLDDESKSLDDLLGALKKGGFDGLRKAAPATRARNRLAQFAAKERERSSKEDDNVGESEHDAEKTIDPSLIAKAGGEPPKPRWPKMTMKQIFEHLLVAMEPEELNHSGRRVGSRRHLSDDRQTRR